MGTWFSWLYLIVWMTLFYSTKPFSQSVTFSVGLSLCTDNSPLSSLSLPHSLSLLSHLFLSFLISFSPSSSLSLLPHLFLSFLISFSPSSSLSLLPHLFLSFLISFSLSLLPHLFLSFLISFSPSSSLSLLPHLFLSFSPSSSLSLLPHLFLSFLISSFHLLQEIKAGLEEVCASHYGRRVLLYLLAPRASRHFCPQFVQLLSPGDNNAHSKKPLEARKKELLKMMAPAVLTLAISHVLEWVRMKTHALLMLQMLLSLPGDLSSLHQPLLEALCGEEGVSLMDNSHTHWVLTQLVANDKSGGDQGTKFIQRSCKLLLCAGR